MSPRSDDKELILVTGIGGFIGSALARRLLAEGHRVVGVDDFSSGKQSNVPLGASLIEGDLAASSTIAQLPESVAAILHLAGQSSGEMSFDDPIADLEKNAVSTLRLSEYAAQSAPDRIIYASSMSVYGNAGQEAVREETGIAPLSCYGVSKSTAEHYLRMFGRRTSFVVMRMFNVYGPGQDMANLRQGMVSIYLAQALASRRIVVKGSLRRFRDFIYVDDVVEAWVRALHSDVVRNETLNIATGVRTEVGHLLHLIQCLIPGTEIEVTDDTPGDQFGIFADTTKLSGLLGLTTFVGLEEGLQRFIRALA